MLVGYFIWFRVLALRGWIQLTQEWLSKGLEEWGNGSLTRIMQKPIPLWRTLVPFMGGDSVGHSCSVCWRHLGDAYWTLLYMQVSQCADRSLQKCMIHSQLVLWHPSKREASLAEQTFLTEMLMQRSIFYLISVHELLESVGRSDLFFPLPGMSSQIWKTSQVGAWFWNWWLLYSFTLVPLEGGGVFVP